VSLRSFDMNSPLSDIFAGFFAGKAFTMYFFMDTTDWVSIALAAFFALVGALNAGPCGQSNAT
jgi:hypothetical protein